MTLDQAFIQAAGQHLSLGLSRTPLPAEGIGPVAADAPLALLALAGQARRFIRPRLPGNFDPARENRDGRSIVTDAARVLLKAIKLSTGPAEQAIADLMERRQLRLHPFDIPCHAGFVKAYAEQLGESAVAFASGGRDKDADASDDFLLDAVDETNWFHASPARRHTFIRDLRAADPTRARDLVQARFSQQNAAARLMVLRAFALGLSSADLPFIESLSGDRAPSVKAFAEQLLSRIPGSAAHRARMKDATSRLKLVHSGLLRRRAEIRIEYPATLTEWQRFGWLSDTFGGLSLVGLAEALNLSVQDMVAAAQKADTLPIVLAVEAIVEQRFELVEALLPADGQGLDLLIAGEGPDLDILVDPKIGARFAETVLRPESWKSLPHASFFDTLYRRLRHPLPGTTMSRLAASPAWQAPVPEERAAEMGAVVQAMIPLATPSCRPMLCQALARLPLAASHRPRLVLDLFDALDPP